MGSVLVIGLVIIVIVLFVAVKKGWIDGKTLGLVATVIGIAASMATVAVFVVPAATLLPTPTTSSLTISTSIPTPTQIDDHANLGTEETTQINEGSSDIVNIDEVLDNIVSGNGGIEIAAPWWKAILAKRENGIYDPTEFPGTKGCFGVAWNVLQLEHTVVVFQSAQALDFQAGGHYSLICLTNNVDLSATDVGRIQSTWLSKEHGGAWRVQVLD